MRRRISRGEAVWDKVCVPAVGDKPGLILMGSKTFLAVRFWGGLALSWMNDSSVGPGSVELGQNLTSKERQGRPRSSWSRWKISLAAVGCEFCTGFLLGKPMSLNTSPYALLSPPPGEEVTFSKVR